MASPIQQPNGASRSAIPKGPIDSAPSPMQGRMRQLPRRAYSSDGPEKRAHRTPIQKKKKPFTNFAQVADRIISRIRKNEYVYTPLSEPSQIRLLIINPAKKTSDPLYCELVSSINEADPPHPYEALSYMWGTEDAVREIKIFYPDLSGVFKPVKPGQNRSFRTTFWARFYVRPNLYAALQYLRHKTKKIVLWVDALCIDQNNSVEKSVQVTKMAEIYNRATNVCVWLGEGNLRSQLALDFIPKLLENTNLVKDKSSSSHWVALAELMRNQWFSRRWVVQELALAREATLHCGHDRIDWGDFADAVALFVDKFDEVQALFSSGTDLLGNIRTGAYALVEVINDYLRKTADGEVERLSSLEILVSRLVSFDASDPRDTIYAVLSLANDTIEGSPTNSVYNNLRFFVPDYNKPIIDVFKDFIDFALKSSESLDIICRHWAPVIKKKEVALTTSSRRSRINAHPKIKLPSWIPLVSWSPYGTPEDALTGRMYGDSFVGTSEHKTYNATPKTVAVWRFGETMDISPTLFSHTTIDGKAIDATEASMEPERSGASGTSAPQEGASPKANHRMRSNGSMFVKGFRLDVIQDIGSRFAQGLIPRECLELAGWLSPDYDDDSDIPKVPDELWRTMVADRGPGGGNPPPFYQRACQKCLAQSIKGDIEIRKLIAAGEDQMVVDFLKRVESVIWNRKFLRSAAKEYKEPRGRLKPRKLFGLAPHSAKTGDSICILLGCSVPVIMREHKSSGHYFEFIGEAYIYGMMGGEALGGRKMDELRDACEEFELR